MYSDNNAEENEVTTVQREKKGQNFGQTKGNNSGLTDQIRQ